MFTIDTSVYINALNPAEAGSLDSQAFLSYVFQNGLSVFSPTLLLVEVAAGVARAFNDTYRGVAMAQAVRGLPGQVWLPLDDLLAEESAHLGAKYRLRGADAVYAAVASRQGAVLVTLDKQQLQRLPAIITVEQPAQALARRV